MAKQIVWLYRLIPISIFVLGMGAVLRLTGVSRMSSRKQLVPLIAAAIIGDVMVRAKMSSDIFYHIYKLPS